MQDRQAPCPSKPSIAQSFCIGWWLRTGLRLVLILAVLLALCLGGIAFWLHRNPQALASHLADEIRQRSGIECSMDTVDVVLFPVPSLGITDIRMHTDTLDVSVAYVTVRPALLALLRGSFEPGSVTLLRPRLVWKAPAEESSQPTTATVSWQNLGALTIPEVLHGTELRVLHGSVQYMDAQHQLDVDSVGIDMRMESPGGLDGSLTLGTTVLRRADAIEASLDGLNLRLSGDPLRVLEGAAARMVLETRVQIPDLLRPLSLRLDVAQKKSLVSDAIQWEGDVNLGGQLLWSGVQASAQNSSPSQPAPPLTAIPFALRGQAQGPRGETLHIRHMQVELGKDKLIFDGTLDPQGKNGPHLSGDLDIRQLSLTQWFGFARRLPPGLQHTLHQLRGSMRFALDGEGLNVSQVDVQAVDGKFSGTGGVPSWKKPVITLDLSAPHVTLGTAFPEVEGKSPTAPALDHAPLTPEPGSPEAKSMAGPDIGYDIALRVGQVDAWRLSLSNAHFRCLPQAQSKGSAHNAGGVLMTFGAGQIHGGRAEGRLLLTDSPTGKTSYAIKADIKNVAVEPLLTRLGGKAHLGGRLTLDTEFTAQGQSLAEFFASQDGSISLRLDNGFVLGEKPVLKNGTKQKASTTDKQNGQNGQNGQAGQNEKGEKDKWTFSRLQIEARARGAVASTPLAKGQRIPAELPYSGQWKASVDAPEVKGSLQLEGPLVLGSQKSLVHFRKLPGQMHVELDKDWLHQWGIFSDKVVLSSDLSADISGRFSLHSQERTLAVEETQAVVPKLADARFKGQYHLTLPQKANGGSEFQAQTEISTPNSHQLLSFFVPALANALPAASLGRAEGHAKIQYQDQSLSLTDVGIKTGKSTASGHITGSWKARPQWKFDLAADFIDVDTYLPPRKSPAATGAASAHKATTSALPPALPWDVAWMKEWDAQGTLSVGTLRVRKLSLHKAHLPLSLKSGVLNCTGRGTLYGAPAKTSLRAEAAHGLKLHFTLEAQNMDMLALSQERGMSTVLAGQGSLWADLRGVARSGNDIPAALDGTWRLQVNEAWTQSRTPKGALTGSKTQLGNIHAQGVMDNGVLESEILTLRGADLTAKGDGWVNLANDTLDVHLLVNMYRIPEFPVRYYGSLDNPERSINAGKAIVGTIGNIGSGVFDVIGNVLGGALKLLP